MRGTVAKRLRAAAWAAVPGEVGAPQSRTDALRTQRRQVYRRLKRAFKQRRQPTELDSPNDWPNPEPPDA